MREKIIIHGAAGTGSVAVEAALTLAGVPFVVEETPEAALATSPSPLAQVPALRLPGGELMTESAAILIWIADSYPAARLGPDPDDPRRPAFLRWMMFVSSAIYAHFWALDAPARVVDGAEARATVKARLTDRIAHCWQVMEAGIAPGTYLLGEEMSVLDLYVTVISRWEPGRRRFHELAPRMGQIVRRVDADPRLAKLWAERFPFPPGSPV